MSSLSSPSSPSGLGRPSGAPATPLADRAAQVRFRRALSLMAMTLVAPGTAQLVAGNRRVGLVAFRTYLGLLAIGAVTVVMIAFDHGLALDLAVNTTLLFWLNIVLMAVAIGWAYLFVDAWRIGQPQSYSMSHRRLSVGLNGVLALGVAGVLLFSAHIVAVQRGFIVAVSGDGEATSATHGRYNVLLIGGDSGDDRFGLRTDSMTVASIDEETGKTVLVGLPRNMANFPFRKGSVMAEQFPDGFDCDGCMLNGVSTWAQDNTKLFGDIKDPGMDATISAIEGITDLTINYWVMVNLDGFRGLVDAVGGVTLDVREPLNIGNAHDGVVNTLPAGKRRLNGYQTLWYARSREGSDDYSRMARQKCVMSAMLAQVSPASAVRNFASIAKATSDMVQTSIPASEFDTFLDLGMKAKSQKIGSISLVPPAIVTAHPDIAKVRQMVRNAIDRSEGKAKAPAKRKRSASSTSMTGGSRGTLKEGYAANDSEDVASAC
ncbi:LCP family protein [Nocardioides plantarum]|uniref:LCP family protein n=1 Tax=Nocardioides plantarum TaxID=29299 RepID=A0ABV5KDA4_9ACTN|nr:LCP family protein [Nocardioides plantarum]